MKKLLILLVLPLVLFSCSVENKSVTDDLTIEERVQLKEIDSNYMEIITYNDLRFKSTYEDYEKYFVEYDWSDIEKESKTEWLERRYKDSVAFSKLTYKDVLEYINYIDGVESKYTGEYNKIYDMQKFNFGVEDIILNMSKSNLEKSNIKITINDDWLETYGKDDKFIICDAAITGNLNTNAYYSGVILVKRTNEDGTIDIIKTDNFQIYVGTIKPSLTFFVDMISYSENSEYELIALVNTVRSKSKDLYNSELDSGLNDFERMVLSSDVDYSEFLSKYSLDNSIDNVINWVNHSKFHSTDLYKIVDSTYISLHSYKGEYYEKNKIEEYVKTKYKLADSLFNSSAQHLNIFTR